MCTPRISWVLPGARWSVKGKWEDYHWGFYFSNMCCGTMTAGPEGPTMTLFLLLCFPLSWLGNTFYHTNPEWDQTLPIENWPALDFLLVQPPFKHSIRVACFINASGQLCPINQSLLWNWKEAKTRADPFQPLPSTWPTSVGKDISKQRLSEPGIVAHSNSWVLLLIFFFPLK